MSNYIVDNVFSLLNFYQNTTLVLTFRPEYLEHWRNQITAWQEKPEEIQFARYTEFSAFSKDDMNPDGARAFGEFLEAVLALLDRRPASLPEGHPNATDLQVIQENVADFGVYYIPEEFTNLGLAFCGVGGLEPIQQFIVEHQELLLQREVLAFLRYLAVKNQKEGDQKGYEIAAERFQLIRYCMEYGIDATFQQMEESPATDGK